MKKMDRKEINDCLNIIFDKESIDINLNSHDVQIITDDIISLYQSLDDSYSKKEFINILTEYLKDQNSNALSIFMTMIKLGLIDLVVEGLVDSNYPKINFSILEKLHEYFGYFDNLQLGKILLALQRGDYYKFGRAYGIQADQVMTELKLLRYSKLKKTLNFHTIEIDNDKREVEKLLKDFGFDKKYHESLNLVDKYFSNEELDETVIPGGVIGVYRQFFDDFYMDIANSIKEIDGLDKIPENISIEKTSKFGHALAYISKEFGISDDEEHLLKGHYGITNSQGAHKLLSNKKYFRLVKNISIEIALFMLTKLEDYKKSKSS